MMITQLVVLIYGPISVNVGKAEIEIFRGLA